MKEDDAAKVLPDSCQSGERPSSGVRPLTLSVTVLSSISSYVGSLYCRLVRSARGSGGGGGRIKTSRIQPAKYLPITCIVCEILPSPNRVLVPPIYWPPASQHIHDSASAFLIPFGICLYPAPASRARQHLTSCLQVTTRVAHRELELRASVPHDLRTSVQLISLRIDTQGFIYAAASTPAASFLLISY